jgi:hypothetical protein
MRQFARAKELVRRASCAIANDVEIWSSDNIQFTANKATLLGLARSARHVCQRHSGRAHQRNPHGLQGRSLARRAADGALAQR